MSGSFTVYFDGSLWVGLVMEEKNGRCQVGRYVFGPEPSPNDIFEWVRKGCPGLSMTEVSGAEQDEIEARPKNPKRAQREARRAMERPVLGTYAQQKVKEAREVIKATRYVQAKIRREQVEEERFRLRQEKKKRKKRGH